MVLAIQFAQQKVAVNAQSEKKLHATKTLVDKNQLVFIRGLVVNAGTHPAPLLPTLTEVYELTK